MIVIISLYNYNINNESIWPSLSLTPSTWRGVRHTWAEGGSVEGEELQMQQVLTLFDIMSDSIFTSSSFEDSRVMLLEVSE